MGAFSRLLARFALRAVGLGSLALPGCTLDERSLDLRLEPQLVAAGGAAADGFGAGGEGGGGAVGVVGSWAFDHDTGDWQSEPDLDQTWSSVDADGRANSGSLVLTNSGMGSGSQYHARGSSVCLTLESGVTYEISAKLRIDTGQNTGAGGFVVEFFNVDGCEGLMLDLTAYTTATTGLWLSGEKMQTAPDGTKSALVRLIASKLEADPPFTVRFDDVRFLAH